MLAALLRQAMPLIPEFPLPSFKAKPFSRKVVVDFTVRDYQVKTVETAEEFKQVLALRRTVFHYEFARKWISLKSDHDAFDDGADHLAIFDRKAGRIAGVYRLIPSQANRPFYSSTEFDISRFLTEPGRKLELSRACINRDYRNGIVISLLWKGIAEYAKAAETVHLFGLSSVRTVDHIAIAKVHRHFENQGIIHTAYGIEPVSKYRIENFASTLDTVDDAANEGQGLVPSLLKTYIRAGAKVCSQPVVDRDFNCADWLTVLDMRRLIGGFDRKYMGA